MAVTIHQSPDTFSHSGNPLPFVFSSDQSALANFSYKVEVSIDGTLRETHEIFPENGIKAHFDASDICERYCSVPLNLATAVYNSLSNVLLKVDVIESYGTPPTDHLNTSSTIEVFKGRLRKRDFINFTPADYIWGAGKLWLTDFPRDEKQYIDINIDNKYQFITNQNNLKLTIDCYDDTGSLVISRSNTASVQEDITTININATTLLSEWSINATVTAQTEYYELYWENGGGTTESEHLIIYTDDRCYSTSYVHLLFLSAIGSLEPYTFIKRTIDKTKIKSFGMEQQFGQFDDAGDYVYSLGGVTDYVKTLEDSKKIQTDFINESEYTWLCQNFLTSPYIFLQDGANLIRVKVSEGSYQLKTSENDMVFNLKANLIIERDTTVLV